MGMWYNYTFARNNAANARCCPEGNNTNIGEWSFCSVVVGNGSDIFHSTSTTVNKCFVEKQNVTDLRLYLQDYPEHPPKASSSSRIAPKPLGVLACIVVALSLASLSLAQHQTIWKSDRPMVAVRADSSRPDAGTNTTDQNQDLNVYLGYIDRWKDDMMMKYGPSADHPMCTHFEPDDPSSWELDGEMPPIVVGPSGWGLEGGASGMEEGPSKGEHWYLNVTWRAEVPVTGNWTALQEKMRTAIPDDRMKRLRKEVYVPFVGDMFAFAGLPRSNYGQPAVSSSAVMIPGTFSECISQTAPTHRGNVSVPYWDRLFYFTALDPL
ncbi:hypothetical protein A1Q2_04532 [Trichosporon asahii var. asahii CBS 8904]|uniref:Uncharacterized protein n=1 Tax=Trichosporon asahii var. asahii (strain CBS 8904) TaxID=1220162 RepID=K1WII4_TRIAC|nr:hypothetical protein A1Q2_04532 [Trichosporon asahii var. asahii CBS 8904]